MPAAGNGSGAEAPANGLEERLARVRLRAEAFHTDLNRAYYQALAGYTEVPGLQAVYEAYPDLFEADRVADVRRALEAVAPDGEDGRRLRYLHEFLCSNLEEEAGKEADERYLTEEAASVVRADGQEVPFRGLRARLRNTPDREVRRRLAAAGLATSRSLQPYLREALQAAHAAARELGAETYVAHRARLSGFDFDFLLAETGRLLEETEGVYAELFAWFARRELGLRRSEVGFWDLPRLLRGDRFDADFPPDRLVENAGRMVAGMGLDLTAGGNVEFDLESRPRKSSRAFCAPIRIPAEIKLVILPSGGSDDYRAFLHELGHSLHFGCCDAAAPFEYRNLGDNSITECYAIAFDHCLLLPGWLRDVQGLSNPRDFLLLHWFGELHLLRRYAAKLRYELALHAAGPEPAMADLYAEELGRATGVEAPRERYLEDVDPRFYCVCYLQAWMLSGLLHRSLRERFDSDWYRNPRSGPFLRALFGRGQRETARELAALLGAEGPGFGPLLEWMRAGVEDGGPL
jgi:oligoendopeptidase F